MIVATGVVPNDGLLAEAVSTRGPGLEVAATMETAVADVFAAGDVARAPMCGGAAGVLALWPVAVAQGRVAGANLAGAGATYRGSLSMNVTEMFGLTVASLGRFVEEDGDDVAAAHVADVEYFKLVSRDGVPAGAVALGGTEGAVVLGRLRPYVRCGGGCPSCFRSSREETWRAPGRRRDLRRALHRQLREEAERMRIVTDPASCVACRNCEYACAFQQGGDFERGTPTSG